MPRKRRNSAEHPEIVTIPCQHQGCIHQATHYPKICVPAKGWSIEAHRPISCTIGIKFCKDHVMGFDVHRMLRQEQKNGHTMEDIFRNATVGMVPPDFVRAYVLAVPLHSEEGMTFLPHGHA